MSDVCVFASKNSNFNAISITFRTFLKTYDLLQQIEKYKKLLKESNSLASSAPSYLRSSPKQVLTLVCFIFGYFFLIAWL